MPTYKTHAGYHCEKNAHIVNKFNSIINEMLKTNTTMPLDLIQAMWEHYIFALAVIYSHDAKPSWMIGDPMPTYDTSHISSLLTEPTTSVMTIADIIDGCMLSNDIVLNRRVYTDIDESTYHSIILPNVTYPTPDCYRNLCKPSNYSNLTIHAALRTNIIKNRVTYMDIYIHGRQKKVSLSIGTVAIDGYEMIVIDFIDGNPPHGSVYRYVNKNRYVVATLHQLPLIYMYIKFLKENGIKLDLLLNCNYMNTLHVKYK